MDDRKYANAAQDVNNYASVKTSVPKNPNFADSVGFADERVSILVRRLSGLAEKLCGSVPENDPNGLSEVPNGLFNSVIDRAGTIARRADEGIDIINRIERSLP